jgi:hypothetical protein
MLSTFDPVNNRGNGYFHNNTTDDVIQQLQLAINTVRELRKNKEMYNSNLRRMMTDIRYRFSLEKMVEGYLQIYDELGQNFNLFTGGYKPFITK